MSRLPEEDRVSQDDADEYSKVLEVLWQLGNRTNEEQFLSEAHALWVDIFNQHPDRITLLLQQLQAPVVLLQAPVVLNTDQSAVQNLKVDCVKRADFRAASPALDFSQELSEHNISRSVYCESVQTEDNYVCEFLQACSLDIEKISHIGTIYPNLRVALFDVSQLWHKYQSTNYNYASTKKWTWKRSKLTEGTEMVKEGLVDVKLKLDVVSKSYNAGILLLFRHVQMEEIQAATASLRWVKSILADVTNRLQKRNQMQRSQELAAKRMKIAKSQFRQFQNSSVTLCGHQLTPDSVLHMF